MLPRTEAQRVVGIDYLALGLLVFGTAFFMPGDVTEPFKSAPEFALVAFGWLVVSTLGPSLWSRRTVLGPVAWLWAAVGLAWLTLTSTLAFRPDVAWRHEGVVVTVALLGLALVAWLTGRPERRGGLLVIVAATFALELLLAYAEWWRIPLKDFALLPGLASTLGPAAFHGHPVGTLGNVNYFAEFLVLVLPMGWAFAWATGRWALRVIASATVLLAVPLLFVAEARAAQLGLLISLPFALWWALEPRLGRFLNSLRHRHVAVGAAAVGAIAAGVVAVALATLDRVPSMADENIASRLINWQAAFDIWRAHPITGVGLGGFKLLNVPALVARFPQGLPEAAGLTRFMQAHSEPIQVLAEVGFVGLAFSFALIAVWLVAVRRNPSLSGLQRLGVVWGSCALLVTSVFGFPMHVPFTALCGVLIMAVGSADTTVIEAAPAGERQYPWAASAMMSLIAIGFIVGVAWPEYEAHRLEFQADRARELRNWGEAERLYAEADRGMRFRGKLRWHEMQVAVRAGRYAEAIAVHDASEREGMGHDAYYWRGRALEESGRRDDALAAYRRVMLYCAKSTSPYKTAAARMKHLRKTSPMSRSVEKRSSGDSTTNADPQF